MKTPGFDTELAAVAYIKDHNLTGMKVCYRPDRDRYYISKVNGYDPFAFNRKEYITAARQLLYPEEVIEKIQAAKTEAEISRIMATARKNS